MQKTNTRKTAMSAADLFVLLDREYRRRRPRECVQCFVQMPFRVDTHATAHSNWEVLIPPSCEASCESLLQDLVLEFQQVYELATAR